jgi:cysteine desulfurase
LDQARQTVAEVLACSPQEIVFTGCGTESDNLAIRGVALAAREAKRGNHLITLPIEHHAVGATVEQLRDLHGFEVTFVEVDQYGMVDPDAIGRAIRPDTILISVMYANNEVGTVQPLAEIGTIARAHGIPLHTDAVQAGGQLNLNVDRLKVDLLALSAHKFYGPKAWGAERPFGHGTDLGVDGRRTRTRAATGHSERGGNRRPGDGLATGAGTA